MKQKAIWMPALLWAVAQGVWAQISVKSEEELINAIADGVTIQLTTDIQLSNYLNIEGKAVTIDLNGNKLSRSMSEHNSTGHVIYANGGCKLTLTSTAESYGCIEGGMANNGGAIHIPHGNEVSVNPVFTGVTIDYSATAQERMTNSWDYFDFVGTFAPIDIFTEDKTTLYLGANDQLFYPSGEGMTSFVVNAFRAYFVLKDGLTAGEPLSTDVQGVKSFDGGETGIEEVNGYRSWVNGYGWYSIDERKLDGRPTEKGMYISDGRKVLIK